MESYFASTYGSGTYESSTYNGSTTSTTTGATTTSSTTGSGVLTDTGFDVILAMSLAVAIIFVALIVKIWHRPARQVVRANADFSNKDYRS
jgi:hypothetical protein